MHKSCVAHLYEVYGTYEMIHKNCQRLLHFDFFFVTINMQVPGVLASLQKSVQAVLLGKSQLPDWFNHGVKIRSHAQLFKLTNARGNLLLIKLIVFQS